jgi:hypothetical protein
MQEQEPLSRAKCYADAPDGTKNKYLVFRSYDFSHSLDIFNRLTHKGWKIRAAFHQSPTGKSMKILKDLITGDVSTTYQAKLELDKKLDEKLNSRSIFADMMDEKYLI